MRRAFDPSKRPRPPRARHQQRRVAAIGQRSDFAEVKLDLLTRHDLEYLRAYLQGNCWPQVAEDLQEIAGEYSRWLDQPEQSRSEVVYELKLIAHLSWKIAQGEDAAGSAQAELAKLMDNLTDDAAQRLQASWDQIGHDKREPLDEWTRRSSAACNAIRLISAGDYANKEVVLAVAILIDAYERHSGETATWSRREDGPVSEDGTYRELAGSACGRFIEAFFRIVDPGVSPSQPHHAMREHLRRRRRRPAQSFPPSA